MNELDKNYSPNEIEEKWYKTWEESKFFAASLSSEKENYSIVIPPPNVTGILHMGHVLNNSIQDTLIRYNRMRGKNTLWMPGCDHAGIATQNKVERKLAEDGLKKEDIGREKFLEMTWDWKEEDTLMLSFILPAGSFATSILSAFCKNITENQRIIDETASPLKQVQMPI